MSDATRRGTLAALAGFLAVPALPVETGSTDYPYAAAFAAMLAAFEEDRRSRPIGMRPPYGGVEDRASTLVVQRCYRLAREFSALPAVGSLHDLGAKAVAAAITGECMDLEGGGQQAIHLIRAVLAFAGHALPAGHIGFQDEPKYAERDEALHAGEGSLPAWALAEARRQA